MPKSSGSERGKGSSIRVCLFAAAWIPCAPLALAQTPPPSLADVSLEDLAQLPVEVVTGASKYEQTIRRAPASVTVLTSEDIANYGWTTLAQALNSTPGFHIRSDRFYDYVGNRGFTRPYDYNSRTTILVNGQRINDSIYQQGSVGTDFLLDTDLISRIEIIRGPGSSVYGSNAFYGAINVIPKQGSDFAGGQVSVTLDDDFGIKARVTQGNRTSSGVDFLISATNSELKGETDFRLSQDWRRTTELPDTVARNRDSTRYRNAFAKVKWKGFEAEAAFGRRVKGVLPEVYYTNVADLSEGIDERAYALVRYTSQPSAAGTLNAKLAFDHYRYNGRFSPKAAEFSRLAPYAQSGSINGEIRWHRPLAGGHSILGGLEYQNNFQQVSGKRDLSDDILVTEISRNSYFASPFGQIDWRITDAITASTGGRYDYYSTGEKRFTPRLGVIWDFDANTTFKILYGESFRVPNIEERFSTESGMIQNPDLRPESNQSWEIVINRKVGEYLSLEANAFQTDSKGLIQSTKLSSDPDTFINTNSQSIITHGIELSCSGYFKSNVQVRASATFENTYDGRTGAKSYDAPDTLLKLNASSPLHYKWLRLSAQVLYVSSRLDANGRSAKGYFTADVNLRAVKLWHRWDLSLGAHNLANARWYDPKNDGQIINAPRTITARVSLDY